MNIKELMNDRFKDLQGGLFLKVSKADVGEGVGKFLEAGGEIMAWADPFFPDPSLPSSVKNAMLDALEHGSSEHYCMPIGMPELRAKLAEREATRLKRPIDPSRNIIITPGSDSGLLYAMMPFIEPGDEVLVHDPSYPSNYLNCTLLGAKPVSVPLRESNKWQLEIEEFEKRWTEKTKMVLLTHPNNPTTTVFTPERLEKLCRFIVEKNLILICDQAFEDHIFVDTPFISPCTLEGMWERTVSVHSISKGFGLSGLRIGYIVANEHIMDVLYGGAVNVLGAASSIGSIGALAALQDEDYLTRVRTKLAQRQRIAYEIFSTIPGVKMLPSESGILAWLNISALGSSEEIVELLMREAKIMVNQGEPYGTQGSGFIRIVVACFADDHEAQERFIRIKQVLDKRAQELGISS